MTIKRIFFMFLIFSCWSYLSFGQFEGSANQVATYQTCSLSHEQMSAYCEKESIRSNWEEKKCIFKSWFYKAFDYAYYGIRTERSEECLEFWTNQYPGMILKWEGLKHNWGAFALSWQELAIVTGPQQPYKIPKKSHHIWITDPKNPKNMELKSLHGQSCSHDPWGWVHHEDNHLTGHIRVLDQDDNEWKHYLWTNVDSGLESLKIIEQCIPNMIVININNNILNKKTIDTVKSFVEAGDIGKAVDLLKYEVLRVHGGIVMDLNFLLQRKPEKLMQYSDFFGQGLGPEGKEYLHNGFIASVPHHPILIKAEELIQRNLSPQSPEYLKKIAECLPYHPDSKRAYDVSAVHTHATTAYPLSIAFAWYQETHPQKDAWLLPYHQIKNQCESIDNLLCQEVDFGEEHFEMSWLKQCAF